MAHFPRIKELFAPKIVSKLSKIWVWDPKSGVRKKPILDPGSRGQKGTGSRIRIRNTAKFRSLLKVDLWKTVDAHRGGAKWSPVGPVDQQWSQIRVTLMRSRPEYFNPEFCTIFGGYLTLQNMTFLIAVFCVCHFGLPGSGSISKHCFLLIR